MIYSYEQNHSFSGFFLNRLHIPPSWPRCLECHGQRPKSKRILFLDSTRLCYYVQIFRNLVIRTEIRNQINFVQFLPAMSKSHIMLLSHAKRKWSNNANFSSMTISGQLSICFFCERGRKQPSKSTGSPFIYPFLC